MTTDHRRELFTMKSLPWMALAAMLFTSSSLQAQIFRRRSDAADPARRVPELIVSLRTDKDGKRRAQAAEELRNFDAAVFTEIVPALAVAAEKDESVAVRLEAVSSLGRLRPVNDIAGGALERIAAHENHLRIRLHAKATLFWYQRAGYDGKTKGGEVATVGAKLAVDPGAEGQGPASIVIETEIPPQRMVVPVQPNPDRPAPKAERPSVPSPLPRGLPFSTALPQQPIIIPRPADDTQSREAATPPPAPVGKSDF